MPAGHLAKHAKPVAAADVAGADRTTLVVLLLH